MATRRGYYRGELLRAVENITMALTHLTRIVEAYEKDYPEISHHVQEIGDAMVAIADLIKALHDTI